MHHPPLPLFLFVLTFCFYAILHPSNTRIANLHHKPLNLLSVRYPFPPALYLAHALFAQW